MCGGDSNLAHCQANELARQIQQPSAAVAAVMGQARLAGLIVDKKEVGAAGDFENMQAADLAKELVKEAAELGLRVVGGTDKDSAA